jgi:archaellin
MLRTAIKAGDESDPLWRKIMDAPAVSRGSAKPKMPQNHGEDNFEDDFGVEDGGVMDAPRGLHDRFPSEREQVYHFIVTYNPPKSLTKHLPFFLEGHGDATALSVEHMGGSMDVVTISIKPHDGSKTTAYQAVERVMVDDLGLQIENIEG